eukprot:scaffold255492_cov44-Attheya_sp.AAC.1
MNQNTNTIQEFNRLRFNTTLDTLRLLRIPPWVSWPRSLPQVVIAKTFNNVQGSEKRTVEKKRTPQ